MEKEGYEPLQAPPNDRTVTMENKNFVSAVGCQYEGSVC